MQKVWRTAIMAGKYIPRLKEKFNSKVAKELKDEFNYKSVMQIPKLEKVVINMGVEAHHHKFLLPP